INKSKNSNIVILGLTFKENTPDFRNSKVIEMIKELNEFGIKPKVIDPYISSFSEEIDADIVNLDDIDDSIDVLIYDLDHKEFQNHEDKIYLNKLNKDSSIIIDFKNRFKQYENESIKYWSL